jgi:uncharacterized protein (DUF433 family)
MSRLFLAPGCRRDERTAASVCLAQHPHRLHDHPMVDGSQCPEVERDPLKVSGAWIVRHSRVPVRALFENLEAGATVDEFLEWFPGVTRTQAEAALRFAQKTLEEA